MTDLDTAATGATGATATGRSTGPDAGGREDVARRPGVLTATLWELEKLTAQLRTRLAFAVCLLGPFVFALGVKLTDNVPADTLFGRWVTDSGLAVPLVVLGFAGAWGFPLLTGLVAGDIFSAEDHFGTWPMLLTRSCGRGTIFLGKLVATAVYVTVTLLILALASLAAGVVVVGDHTLIGLSGNLLAPGHAAELVLLAWAGVLPPCLAFAAIGILLSVATRHSLAAIVGSVVLGLVMQLLTMVDGIEPIRRALLGTQFLAWHGLFADPAFHRPLVEDLAVSAGYAVVCVSVAWLLLRRRDVSGA